MNALIRLWRALPLVVFLVVLAVVVYAIVSSFRSPRRAKEILVKLFLVLTGVLTSVFSLLSAYALLESNEYVFEWFGIFAAVSALALLITLFCRWRLKRTADRAE